MNKDKAIKVSVFSIISNTAFALVKAIAGIFGNSFALIADAIESMSDVVASLLVYLGLRYSTRPADENHPYGHGKAEPLITFIVVGFLLISSLIIFIESVKNIQTPHDPPKPFTLIVLALIVLVKELMFRFVNKKSDETKSTSLKADAWHHRSDAITSLLAFFGISIALIMGDGWESADDWAALGASFLIAYNAYHIFRPALGEIMDEDLYEDLAYNITELAKKVDGVKLVEKINIRKAGMDFYVDMHIMVDANITVSEGHTIGHHLKGHIKLNYPEVADVLIHVEPDVCEFIH